jgi:hypothetical protein
VVPPSVNPCVMVEVKKVEINEAPAPRNCSATAVRPAFSAFYSEAAPFVL